MKTTVTTLAGCVALLLVAGGCTTERRGPGLPMTTPGSADSGTSSSSGVPASLTLSSLTDAQVTQLCTWSIDQQGGPDVRTECPDGTAVTSGSVSDCSGGLGAAPGTCGALTVGEIEACFRSASGNPCDFLTSEACQPLIACGMATDI